MKIKNNFILIGLIATAMLQFAVLAAKYLVSVYPIWVGQPIFLKLQPVDPRSLFRGQYVRLNYEISRIERKDFLGNMDRVRSGHVVYVALLQDGDNWKLDSVTAQRPSSGVYLRGRAWRTRWEKDHIRVRYGIEAYFSDPKSAIEMENRTRRGQNELARAELRVTEGGRAALVGLHFSGT